MLTAIIGETTINCFDGKYDRYRLKQWSNKGLIKCPVCKGNYEYCHGEIVSPYFRHVGKECLEHFHESETEEHRKGKELLFEWISKEDGVENCKLEHWIPETKQRPDIYFEFNQQKYVIEYQCSPIASEFLVRRELYRLAGIVDIWILGTEKYNIEYDENNYGRHFDRFRVIESTLINENLIYFNPSKQEFLFHSSYLSKAYNLMSKLSNKYSLLKFYHELNVINEDVNDFNQILVNCYTNDAFFQSEIKLRDSKIDELTKLDQKVLKVYEHMIVKLTEEDAERIRLQNELKEKYQNLINKLNSDLGISDSENALRLGVTSSNFYKYSVLFQDQYIFFVKGDCIDFCQYYNTHRPITNWRNKTQWVPTIKNEKIRSFFSDYIDEEKAYDFIFKSIDKILNPYREEIKSIKDILNQKIKIIDSGYIVPPEIRFKFLKEHNFGEINYVITDFAKEVRKLKNREQVFLLKGFNRATYCIEKLKSYGFENIEMLSGCTKK